MTSRPRTGPVIVALLLASLGSPRAGADDAARTVSIDFTTSEGWTYDGVLELPVPAAAPLYGVILLGGARGSSLDWTLPAWITVDGAAHPSAAVLSRSLRDAGFAVMRWHAIRRGETGDVPSYAQTVEQTRRALAAFMAHGTVPLERTFVLGHSLGARRAVVLVRDNPDLAGLVLLAPSSVDPLNVVTMKRLRDDVRYMVALTSEESQDFLTAHEYERLRARPELAHLRPHTFAAVDLDEDGVAEAHELFATLIGAELEGCLQQGTDPGDALESGSELLAGWAKAKPVLVINGGRDPRFVLDGAFVVARLGRERATWHFYPELGHYLGAIEPGLVTHERQVVSNFRLNGIAPEVVSDLVRWLVEQRRQRVLAPAERP